MSQPQSALLRLPAELRHDIYSYLLPDGIHAHLRGGKLNLSPCLEHSYLRRNLYLDGDERDPAAQRGWTPTRGYPTDTPTHLRRLESTWGPHWMCEEQFSESKERFDMTLALVCKSMYVQGFVTSASTYISHASTGTRRLLTFLLAMLWSTSPTSTRSTV
jgi:hypothetical protein